MTTPPLQTWFCREPVAVDWREALARGLQASGGRAVDQREVVPGALAWVPLVGQSRMPLQSSTAETTPRDPDTHTRPEKRGDGRGGEKTIDGMVH